MNKRVARLIRAGWALLVTIALLGCGGGGGVLPVPMEPPPPQSVDGQVSATFNPAPVRVSSVSRQTNNAAARVRVALTYTGNRNLYIALNQSGGLLANYGTNVSGPEFDVDLSFLPASSVGTLRGELQVRVCFDTQCSRETPGSPLRVPLEMEVLPNIELPAEITLARSGRDAAPTLELPVQIPAAAGPVTLRLNGDGFGTGTAVSWNGSAIRVETTQVRAGRYERQLTLESASDPRYRASATVIYTVAAPAGGERPLQISPDLFGSQVEQGRTATQRLQVQRPTWTDAFAGPTFTSTHPQMTLHDMGGDQFEIRLDAANLAVGTDVEGVIGFSAGLTGGLAESRWRVRVTDAFSVGNGLAVSLETDSDPTALRMSAPVLVASGAPARWTARALTPGMRLLRNSGITGVEPVELEVDAAAALASIAGYEGTIELTLDRPGTQPITTAVIVYNRVPRLKAALRGPLLPGSNVLYVDGDSLTQELIRDRLQVSGASLRSASLLFDTRWVGSVVVLRIELDGAIPGQDVELRLPTTLLNVPVRVPVVATPTLPAGYATLPLARWRSPQFALSQGALYFAAPGQVVRWGAWQGGWSLSRADVPGSEDMGVFGNQSRLIAFGGPLAWRLDPDTLAVVEQASIDRPPFWVGDAVDPRVPDAMSAVAIAADGAVNVAISRSGGSLVTALGVGLRVQALSGVGASPGDVGNIGSNPPAAGAPSVGLIRSTLGATTIGQFPDGRLRVHRAVEHMPQLAQTLPPGVWARAVSDEGDRVIASDGTVWLRGVALPGTLAAAVPAGFMASGWGLTGHGRWALVYMYRIAEESGAPRARDPALWVFDLSALESTGVAGASVLARLPLADAVGCNTALAAGETCVHAASVVTAPGDRHAFVLGPRGVASVPLDTLPAATAASRAKASAPREWVPVGVVPAPVR